jgi:hypothetical protein
MVMDETSAVTTTPHRHPLRRIVIPPKLPKPINPALLKRADQQWKTVLEEDQQNREFLQVSEQILDLTKAVHAYARAARPDLAAGSDPAAGDRRPEATANGS